MYRPIAFVASLAFVFTVFAVPAAATPLLFEWSGTDENSDPFSITFTVTDAQNGDAGYDFNSFSSSVFVATESLGQSQIISNVTSDSLGGAFAYPTSTADDPYFFIFASPFIGSSGSFLQMAAGADFTNIGLTFNANPIEYLEVTGALPFTFGDPSTAGSLSDLLPVGTYAVTRPSGLISWDSGGSSVDLMPTSLTISALSDSNPPTTPVPEPATVGLLGLGLAGLALRVRRRRRAAA